MKLEFHGHDERYIVEQSLMNLFPLEKPVYGTVKPGEDGWCRLNAEETADTCHVTAALHYCGQTAAAEFTSPLSGTDFEREGQRRHAVAACFYLAFLELYPQLSEAGRAAGKLTLPPWGMLTGVRPDKPVTWALMEGKTPEEAKSYLKTHYFVPEERAALALEESFDLSACPELTVEAGRPDTITAEKLAVLKCHGVTRVSVNPQTMEDRVLAAIGRRHTAVETEQAMELVRAYHFPHVNMDLIAGLPEDTPEGFRRSLDKCLELGASNITVHTLALKKGSRILTEGLSIPDGAAVQAMLDYAAPTLRRAGFAPYYLYRQKYMSGSFENVGWCRPGGECWYNVDIMSELCSILSFGAGGSTKMVEPGTNHIERVFNVKYPKEYTERPEKTLQNQAAFAEFYAKYVPEA